MSDAEWSQTDREERRREHREQIQARTQQQVVEICGKQYAGALVDVRPCWEFGLGKKTRTIYGTMIGQDQKGRGFDNKPIRTSVVDKLVVYEGAIYAITRNSAYRLDNLCLMAFIGSDTWADDIINLAAMEKLDNKSGVLSMGVQVTYGLEPERFSAEVNRQGKAWVHVPDSQSANGEGFRMLSVGNKTFFEVV